MDLETAISIIDRAFIDTEQPTLTNVERYVLKGSWHQKTYEEMAEESNYTYSYTYLKQQVGPQLWRKISQALKKTNPSLKMKVLKSNFLTAINRLDSSKKTEHYVKPKSEIVTYQIVVTGKKKLIEPITDDFTQRIRTISGDFSIKCNEVKEGSIIFMMQGSLEGFERLQTLFINGELTEILGFPIESIELESVEPTDTREWLENLFNTDWQPVETVLAGSSMRSSVIDAETSETMVYKAKVIYLARNISIVAIVRFNLSDEEIQASLEIYPAANNAYLPEGLIIEILDESEAIAIRKEVESDIDSMQIPFSFEPEEQFTIRFTLENISITENLFSY